MSYLKSEKSFNSKTKLLLRKVHLPLYQDCLVLPWFHKLPFKPSFFIGAKSGNHGGKAIGVLPYFMHQKKIKKKQTNKQTNKQKQKQKIIDDRREATKHR